MLRIKSNLNWFILLLAMIGLVFVIGCGPSEDKLKMSGLLQEFSKTLDEYSDAVAKADTAKKAEIEGKLKSYEHKWSAMKMEMADKVTPQVLDEMDNEYHKIENKFKTLAGKS